MRYNNWSRALSVIALSVAAPICLPPAVQLSLAEEVSGSEGEDILNCYAGVEFRPDSGLYNMREARLIGYQKGFLTQRVSRSAGLPVLRDGSPAQAKCESIYDDNGAKERAIYSLFKNEFGKKRRIIFAGNDFMCQEKGFFGLEWESGACPPEFFKRLGAEFSRRDAEYKAVVDEIQKQKAADFAKSIMKK